LRTAIQAAFKVTKADVDVDIQGTDPEEKES